jgi:hypothetical protein
VDQKNRLETAALFSKGLGGVALLATIPFAWKAYPSRLMALVLAWWAFEALQITLCSFAYCIKPWEVLPGQSICSARLGMDLGALGIMFVALILWRIVKSSNTQEAEKWQ